jgi:hypothetical protein
VLQVSARGKTPPLPPLPPQSGLLYGRREIALQFAHAALHNVVVARRYASFIRRQSALEKEGVRQLTHV